MDVSIIIPAFNEQAKISTDIISAEHFLLENKFTGQIIIVDDGSTDKTFQVAEQTKVKKPIMLLVIKVPQHVGKGNAIRTGVNCSQGRYVLFADSGNCIPYKYALSAIRMIQEGQCDMGYASRKLPQSTILKPQSLRRQITSWIFRNIVLFRLVPSELTDTQCGFKVYKGDIARKLYAQSVCDGFLLDVEIIKRAVKNKYRIREFPVEWSCDPDSRLSLFKNLPKLIRELGRLMTMR